MTPLLLALFADHDSPEALLAKLCSILITNRKSLSAAERDLVHAASHHTVPTWTVDEIRADITAGHDPLGDVFCTIRTPETRRSQGQFYTPPAIVDAMVGWALPQNPARVIDAGSGSGRYALAVRRAGFTGELIAVDPDPLAALMTRAHLSVAGFTGDVRCVSFLDHHPARISGVTAFVGNPPYLRHHNLGPAVKAWAKQAGARQSVPVSGLAGLHALFFLAVAEQAQAGDVCTFITSSEWMDAKYGQLVRELLAGPLGLVRLDVVDPAALTFDDATTTAAVSSLLVGHTRGPRIRHVTTPAGLHTLAGGAIVPRARLGQRTRWSTVLEKDRAIVSGMVPLGTHVKVSRGIATGNNGFFALTPAAAQAAGLTEHARPLVSKAQEVIDTLPLGRLSASGLRKVLLELPDARTDIATQDWVTHGEADNIHEGYINRSRSVWYQITVPEPPDALATYMARQAPVFALNVDGALNLNTVHGLRRRETFPAELVPVLVDWLNAHRDTLEGGRTYAGGLRKIEPKDMETLIVPDVAELIAWRDGQ